MASSTILSDNGASSGSAGLKTSGGNDGKLILQTATSGGTATDAVTIDTSQNVGIGTSSPSGKLSTAVPDGSTVALYAERTGASPASLSVTFANQYANLLASGVMAFHTNGTQQALIDTAGLFKFNSGYGSVATAYGCRAWVYFVVSGGTPAIQASGNISSITDNGVGDFTFNFTTSMPDANYSFVGLGTAGGANYQIAGGNQSGGTLRNTGSLRTAFGYVSNISGSLTSQDPASASIHIIR